MAALLGSDRRQLHEGSHLCHGPAEGRVRLDAGCRRAREARLWRCRRGSRSAGYLNRNRGRHLCRTVCFCPVRDSAATAALPVLFWMVRLVSAAVVSMLAGVFCAGDADVCISARSVGCSAAKAQEVNGLV